MRLSIPILFSCLILGVRAAVKDPTETIHTDRDCAREKFPDTYCRGYCVERYNLSYDGRCAHGKCYCPPKMLTPDDLCPHDADSTRLCDAACLQKYGSNYTFKGVCERGTCYCRKSW